MSKLADSLLRLLESNNMESFFCMEVITYNDCLVQVSAVAMGNGLCEEVVVNELSVLKLRNVKDLPSAAGLPVAFGTAHLAICERARLQAGQTILILGAAGGVGMAAVQVKTFGHDHFRSASRLCKFRV